MQDRSTPQPGLPSATRAGGANDAGDNAVRGSAARAVSRATRAYLGWTLIFAWVYVPVLIPAGVVIPLAADKGFLVLSALLWFMAALVAGASHYITSGGSTSSHDWQADRDWYPYLTLSFQKRAKWPAVRYCVGAPMDGSSIRARRRWASPRDYLPDD